jgi:glycosyltransferase involved in cell wall biosynthesis
MLAFREAGHHVELLARAGEPLAQRAAEQGFVVHALRHVAAEIKFLACRGGRYDILHAQTANTLTWAVLTKSLHRRPVVFSRRTSFVVKRGSAWKTAFKWRRVDRFIAISHYAALEPQRFKIHPIIIPSAVLMAPVDAHNLAQFCAEFKPAGKKIIATSAALIADKDPLTMIRAVAELYKCRRDFVFIHFGAGGDSEAQARALVVALGLEAVYQFAGFRQGIEDFYPAMDVFAMSSREEALGSSVFDAFLHRVPVASTDAGGLKESLADGRGLLAAVEDAKVLARNMARLLNEPELRQQVTQRAYDYVRAEHDVQKMGNRYLAQFATLLRS